jgi:polyferredoxin
MSKIVAVIAAGLFAAGTILAADPGKCAEHVAACKALVDKFNLTQVKKDAFKRTLDAYQSTGCTPAGYIALKSYAQVVLTTSPEPKQFETFKAECRQIPTE